MKVLETAVSRDVAPALEELRKLPAPGAPEAKPAAAPAPAVAVPDSTSKRGFFEKLAGVFKKK